MQPYISWLHKQRHAWYAYFNLPAISVLDLPFDLIFFLASKFISVTNKKQGFKLDLVAECICTSVGELARARPAVPLGLWSITSSLRGNLNVPRLRKFIKWFADNDAPTTIKLVLSCLWYRYASVSTNMFSDCRNLIALKSINLRWFVATKCASSETVQSRWVAMTGTRCLAFV